MEEENTQTTEAVTATEAPKEAPTRPEYISEKFWDTDRNEIKVEELGASYNALEKKLGMRTDELSKQIRTDIEQERKSVVPEEYKIVVPEVPEHINIEVNKAFIDEEYIVDNIYYNMTGEDADKVRGIDASK